MDVYSEEFLLSKQINDEVILKRGLLYEITSDFTQYHE